MAEDTLTEEEYKNIVMLDQILFTEEYESLLQYERKEK